MSWQGIEGHDAIVEQFRRAISRGRLASSFLFVGPPGIGKRKFAMKLAQALLCENVPEAELNPCGQCPACLQVASGSHPDVDVVAKPADRAYIPIESFIGPKERRMREGLCHNIGLKPVSGRRRVAIIDDADWLNVEGANCLLKTLEEPPPRSVLILIGTSLDRQLPTIRSRCQVVRFAPLDTETAANLLVEQQVVADLDAARELASLAGGSLSAAAELADEALRAFRRQLLAKLAMVEWDSVALAAEVNQFIEKAGKEAPARRARGRLVLGFAAEFYRNVARALAGLSPEGDAAMHDAAAKAAQKWPGTAETAAACFDRCVDARQEIDRMAMVNFVIDCWADEILRLAPTGYVITKSG